MQQLCFDHQGPMFCIQRAFTACRTWFSWVSMAVVVSRSAKQAWQSCTPKQAKDTSVDAVDWMLNLVFLDEQGICGCKVSQAGLTVWQLPSGGLQPLFH